MPRPFERTREQKDQPRHQKEDGQHTAHDALREHDAEIVSEPELHQHQGDKSRNGGQRRRRNLDDRVRECRDQRRPVVLGALDLVLIAVREDDRVVDRERELQDHGDRVGDRGDLPEPEVGPHIEKRRDGEHDQVDHDLEVTPRREEQHQNDHGERERHHDHHFFFKHALVVVAHLARDRDAIGRLFEQRPDLLHRRPRALALFPLVEGDREQGVPVLIVVSGVVETDLGDVFDLSDRLRQFFRFRERDVLDQNPRRTVGRELVLHHVDPAPRLGFLRQKRRQRRVDLDAPDRERAVDRRKQKKREDHEPPGDDRFCDRSQRLSSHVWFSDAVFHHRRSEEAFFYFFSIPHARTNCKGAPARFFDKNSFEGLQTRGGV